MTKSLSSNKTEYLDNAAGELWQINTSFNANGIVFHVWPFTFTRMRFARIGRRFKLLLLLLVLLLLLLSLLSLPSLLTSCGSSGEASDDANKISLNTSSTSFASAAHNQPVDRRSSSAFFVNVKHGAKTAGSVFIPINFGLTNDDVASSPPSSSSFSSSSPSREEEEEEKEEEIQ